MIDWSHLSVTEAGLTYGGHPAILLIHILQYTVEDK